MRIALVLNPFSDENLRLAAQLGVEDIVAGLPAGNCSHSREIACTSQPLPPRCPTC